MTISMILLAGFWATVWSVIKWILVGVGVICLVSSLVLLVLYAIGEEDEEALTSSGIFAIPGILLTLWWLFIPYWSICQWVLFLVLLILTIVIRYNNGWTPIFIGFLIGTLILATYLILVHLIIPYWKICLIVLGTIVGIILVYKGLFIPFRNYRRKCLIKKLKTLTSGIPFLENAISDSQSATIVKQTIKKFRALNKQMKQATTIEEQQQIKKKIFEEKLFAFYKISLPAEYKGDEYSENYFTEQLNQAISENNVDVLRKDREEQRILNNLPTTEAKIIEEFERKYDFTKDNINFESRLKAIKNMDVSPSGFSLNNTSERKIKNQTLSYQALANSISEEGIRLSNIQQNFNTELNKIRLIAYRNIYLGIELLNYGRDNSGGEKHYAEKDMFNIDISKFNTIDINIGIISMDYANVINDALNKFNNFNSSFGKNTGNVGKGLAAIIAGATAYAEEHEKKINANRKAQAELVEIMRNSIPKIQEAKTALKETFELMEAIVKVNEGFYRKYAELRDKVFKSNERLSMDDVQKLVEEINEFRKISVKKIKK